MVGNEGGASLTAFTLDGKTIALNKDDVVAFRKSLRGQVFAASDAGYDSARSIWNGMIDRRPALIARCIGAADVIQAVKFARQHDLLLGIRSGGHNVAGNAMCDGGLVIDLSAMKGVYVDPKARTAVAQGGVTLGEIDREAQIHGLAASVGVVSNTGIAGLTLGGGIGYLSRLHGLTIDNLLSVDVVTAEGELITASAADHPDLFWALRGGGGNFGVVTAFKYKLHQHGPMVMLGATAYLIEDGEAALSKWHDFMSTAPRAMAGAFVFWTLPPDPDFPPEYVGKTVAIPMAIYNGDITEGERLVAPMKSFAKPLFDMSRPVSWLYLQTMFDRFIPNGARYYWKSLYIDDLSATPVQAIVEAGKSRPSGDTMVILVALGGAISDVPSDETAFGRRDMPYLLELDSSWTDPSDDAKNIAWTRENDLRLERYSNGGYYLNFPGLGEDGQDKMVRSAVGADNFSRLVQVKNKYDPKNAFRVNLNIKPTI